MLARPWPLILAGLTVLFLAVVVRETSATATPLRVFFIVAGMVLVGMAVSRRLQTASQELEERVESAGLVAVAAFAGLVACLGTDETWDSIRLLLAVLIGIALFGTILVLLPRTPRRIIASLLVLFHFGGIATAVTAIPPRDQPAPWLSVQLWTRVYRPYLTFMYLTNAYHFYSPDPGPPMLLWFRVTYDDTTYRWIKLPVRQESPIGLHFQRMLALGESTNVPQTRLPLSDDEKKAWEASTGQTYPNETWNSIYLRRQVAGVTQYEGTLPLPTDVAANMLYSEPQEYAKELIKSYARHVARSSPHPENPQMPVKSVRVYRVRHDVISPAKIAEGIDPLDPLFYLPVYMGEFNPEGTMIDPRDPFLYWYIPMCYVPANYGKDGVPLVINRKREPTDKVLNGVEIHAGDAKFK